MNSTFAQKVRETVAKIPRGEVRTYSEIAKLSGNEKAARAVGNILHENHDRRIPCHRVVRSNGKIGGYNLGAAEKIRKLKSEGVKISGDAVA
ncbi:MAG: MGMT family protein [Patescibacteria group bacterium]